jgi:cation diffusion facilitator CzcD-associated flavoprotein CzcO
MSENNANVDVDVAVVGAGLGGLYAVYRLRSSGFSVQGFEGAPDVGGVWYHNRYPGARVDLESPAYAYFFDEDFSREWKWTERYAAQPELLAYLQAAADRFQLRQNYRFETWVTGAQWEPGGERYRITTDDGVVTYARFLVMATGQLSRARKPAWPGLDSFQGQWVQTANWPESGLETEGKRIGVIGTGASGVQTITALAPVASELVVFQRTPHYSIPAHNGPLDEEQERLAREDPKAYAEALMRRPAAAPYLAPEPGNASDYSPEQQRELIQRRWDHGGHSLNAVFADQALNMEAVNLVGDFVREKIREKINDPELAEKLTPRAYPIGTRRLIVDTGYFEVFNRDNVSLVDVNEEPIESITPVGIKTPQKEYELDLIVFAIGFDAFTGALDQANITNEDGLRPTDHWERGPRTYLGLMLSPFPNLFVLTGPQSPSVLANMFFSNVQHVDLVNSLLVHMRDNGYTSVVPTKEAEDAWVDHANEASSKILRRQVDNYMVHVNPDDGSRFFIPYIGGIDAFSKRCDEILANDFEGFTFSNAQRHDVAATPPEFEMAGRTPILGMS